LDISPGQNGGCVEHFGYGEKLTGSLAESERVMKFEGDAAVRLAQGDMVMAEAGHGIVRFGLIAGFQEGGLGGGHLRFGDS
jgi:hypothetical protein